MMNVSEAPSSLEAGGADADHARAVTRRAVKRHRGEARSRVAIRVTLEKCDTLTRQPREVHNLGTGGDCRFATQELSETHFHFLSETVDVASRDGTKPRASRSTGVRPSGSPRRHRPEGAFQLSDPSHLPFGARAAREAPRPTRITTHAARRSLFANRRRGGGCARRVSATGRERTTRRSDFRGELPRAWMTHASSPACETSSCRVAQPRARPRASSASADPRRSRRRFALRVLSQRVVRYESRPSHQPVVFFSSRENKTSPEAETKPPFPVASRVSGSPRVRVACSDPHHAPSRETHARNPRTKPSTTATTTGCSVRVLVTK